jgi:hypothetical protein
MEENRYGTDPAFWHGLCNLKSRHTAYKILLKQSVKVDH